MLLGLFIVIYRLAQMTICHSHGQDVVSHYWIASCWLLISSSVLGCWIVYCPRCVGGCTFQCSYLSVGLFTLMYIDSLIVLAKLLSSLPIILKFSIDVSWPLMLWCWNIGEGAFKCSLYLSPNVLPDSAMYSSPQSMLPQE